MLLSLDFCLPILNDFLNRILGVLVRGLVRRIAGRQKLNVVGPVQRQRLLEI